MTDKILEHYAAEIEEIILYPSSGGRFEVRRDDVLIFSKAALGRHADPDEIVAAIKSATPVTR